jgi:hypothetical protein
MRAGHSSLDWKNLKFGFGTANLALPRKIVLCKLKFYRKYAGSGFQSCSTCRVLVQGEGFLRRERMASKVPSRVDTTTTPKFTTMSTLGPLAKRNEARTLAQESSKAQLMTALDNVLAEEPPVDFAGRYLLMDERAVGGQAVVQVIVLHEIDMLLKCAGMLPGSGHGHCNTVAALSVEPC